MKRIVALMLILMLALSCISIVACGGDDDKTRSEEPTEEPTQEATEATGGDETPGGDSFEGLMGFDSYDELDSYHTHMVMKSDMPMVGETEMIMDEDIDNKSNASHSVIDMGMGMGKMETIIIGDETWTKAFGDQWMYSSGEDGSDDFGSEVGVSDDFMDDFDLEHDLDYKGKEKINGVNCKHYEVDATIMMANPDPQSMIDEVESTFVGDIWIADEGGIPDVVIRMTGTTTVAAEGMNMVMEIQTDVTKINDSVDISPPPEDQIMDIGGGGGFGGFDPDDLDLEDMDDLEDLLGDMDFEMPEGWGNP